MIANSVTHGVGLMASLVAAPVLINAAVNQNDPWRVVGVTVYAVSLVLLYAASTAYHSFPRSNATTLLRTLDHSAIYLLIAGSYTPFALGPLRGPWGWSLLAAVWTMALVGVALKTLKGFGSKTLTTTVYIVMGWLSVVAIKPLITLVGPAGFWWLLAGGLCYTGGVVFYATDKRVRYGHAVWHVFVLAGSTCHFFAVLWHSGSRPG
ncbi:MAG TPA: hemolysin III family protein [Gemmatimonadaceae bacterium]|nr:hemolysin III family protein [Gemmatimonadaceae bacterium]